MEVGIVEVGDCLVRVLLNIVTCHGYRQTVELIRFQSEVYKVRAKVCSVDMDFFCTSKERHISPSGELSLFGLKRREEVRET